MAGTQDRYANAGASAASLLSALVEVAVLDADVTLAAAMTSLASWADDATVVVVDRVRRPWTFVPVPVALVRAVVEEQGPGGEQGSAVLREVVAGWLGAPAVQVGDLTLDTRPGAVVLLGDEVVGLVTSVGSDRSIDRMPLPGAGLGDGSTEWSPGGAGWAGASPWDAEEEEEWDADEEPEQDEEDEVEEREEAVQGESETEEEVDEEVRSQSGKDPSDAPPSATPPVATPPPSRLERTSDLRPPPSGTPGRFRALPLVMGPAGAVPPGELVLLEVGFAHPTDLSRQAPEDTTPIHLARAEATVTFEIRVMGAGLDFGGRTSYRLTAPREAPWTSSVTVEVTPLPVPVATTRTVDLLWYLDGVSVGSSWCDLQVAGADQHVTLPPTAPPVPLGGSAGVDPALAEVEAPDLTVTIVSNQGSPLLQWDFASPHPLPTLTGPVSSAYASADAKVFAGSIMTLMEGQKAQPTLDGTVRGRGADVTGLLPVEFLRALDAAWRGALAAGHPVPTMLLRTNEPWIPWELAWLQAGVDVDPAVLPPGSPGTQLGIAWSIGRWPRATRRNHGPDLPVPPSRRVDQAPMAVVVADYTGGIPSALPHAVTEGTTLVSTYAAREVAIEDESFRALMDARLTEDDGRAFLPHLVHITSHGDTTVGLADVGGIKLKSGQFFGQAAVASSLLGSTSAPLVFLNACRVGTAGTVLNTYAGLPGAFIGSGCRGFIAPLWKVDDDLAAELSLAFYAQVLHPDPAQRLPVGEAVRRIRETYAEGARGTSTPLAYVFYGHPLLRLDQPTGPAPVDPTDSSPPADPLEVTP